MLTLVLDTNVVLDWLVFNDPLLNQLQPALHAHRIKLLTSPLALTELVRVLNYPALKLDATRQTDALQRYQSCTQLAALPMNFAADNLQLPIGFPTCRDPDDQHFLAMTLHSQANALVTRDKAVLKLRKRAGKFSVRIIDAMQLSELLAMTIGK